MRFNAHTYGHMYAAIAILCIPCAAILIHPLVVALLLAHHYKTFPFRQTKASNKTVEEEKLSTNKGDRRKKHKKGKRKRH